MRCRSICLQFGSLVLTIFGIVFHAGADVKIVEIMELTTKKNIRDLITNTRIGDVDNIDKVSFTDLLGRWIADVMIGVGLGFFTLSFSGCCGAWYEVRCLLLVVSTWQHRYSYSSRGSRDTHTVVSYKHCSFTYICVHVQCWIVSHIYSTHVFSY